MTALALDVGACSSPDADATALTKAISTATDLQAVGDGFVGSNDANGDILVILTNADVLTADSLAPQILREW